ARHTADEMRGRSSIRIVMGNALIGRLLASHRQREVPIWLKTEVLVLTGDRSRVTGVTVRREGREVRLAARAGVVLAGGGFIGNPELRDRLLPKVTSFTPGAPTNSGGLIAFALGLGARLGE